MKKRWLAAMAISVMLVGLTGCGANESATTNEQETVETADEGVKDSTEVKIGISMPTLQEERWQKDRDIIIEKLMDSGVEEKNILVQSADGDEQKQVTQCDNLITQGIDALIIFPQNGDASVPVVKSAHEAGVKVVSVDRLINNSDLDFYITYEATEIGRIQGEYITNMVDSGKWIMIAGAPQDPNATLIRNGQMEYVQPLIDAGKVEVVLDQAANYWNPDEALLYTEQGLTANNNDIQCVFTSNDGCAGAAIEALEEQGLAGKVPVPGLDADLAACQRIVEGTQTMTVYRRLAVQDECAAEAAFAFATGQDPADVLSQEIEVKNNGKIDVPSVLLRDRSMIFAVDATNMEEVVKDGWLKAEDIYKNVPEDQWPDWAKE